MDCTGTYRSMLTDAVPFGSSLTFSIEHGSVDEVQADYSSTAYWYGRSTYTEKLTDTLDIGNPASEQAHGYSSPDPGAATSLTSTFEGNDGTPQLVTHLVRATGAPVSFKLTLDKRNRGVLLRRTSDQGASYQQAAVTVDGQPAGTWLEPLGNSDHRWLDDAFQLGAALTGGRSVITVRLSPVKDSPAWSAARYTAQSFVAPFADRRAPSHVTGLTATGGQNNAITLSWNPSSDTVGVDHYNVYGSQSSPVGIGPATLVGQTAASSCQHSGLGLRQRWYYRVVAVDAAGNAGAPSAQVSATTGDILRIEAEALLPPVETTAPAEAQGNCCGISWSGGAQLWFRPPVADNHVTVAFTVPVIGRYELSSVQTLAPDYGISNLAVDGTVVGTPFDGFHANGVAVSPLTDDGSVQLSAGRHVLTLTVTGKNAAAIGYSAGLDYLTLQLAG